MKVDAMEELQLAMMRISIKHALLVEKRLDEMLSEPKVSDASIANISDGIRMVAYVLTVIEKIKGLTKEG